MVYKSRRRIIRERVLQVLFAFEMNKDSLQYLKDEILTDFSNKIELEFANDLINKTVEHVKEFDVMIKGRVNNWEIGRIALIDKILIQIGICELLYFPDIPPKVTINESLEIAKEYSTAGSAKFINGILDAILSSEKKSGRLNKQGRGLVERNIPKSSEDS